jgi:hypothetical protein
MEGQASENHTVKISLTCKKCCSHTVVASSSQFISYIERWLSLRDILEAVCWPLWHEVCSNTPFISGRACF